MEPTRTKEHYKKIIDNNLTNSSEKVIQSDVLKWDILFMSLFTNVSFETEHRKISFRSIKNYSDEISVENLGSAEFPDYSNHNYVNNAYQDFGSKFLQEVDSVTRIRSIRVKYNRKPVIEY